LAQEQWGVVLLLTCAMLMYLLTLLDLKTEISEKARERIHKSRPPLLIDKSKINNIKVGNISDDFNVVKDADWIVEAVVERIDIKHQIYEKIFKEEKMEQLFPQTHHQFLLKFCLNI
jgi:3-hydroxyacyl-CoA dehydrogenase